MRPAALAHPSAQGIDINTCACVNISVTRWQFGEPEACDAAAEVFKALSAPARLLILRRLADGSACVRDLGAELGLSQPLVSQHLRVLRQAHLVRGVRRGREIVYEVADRHVVRIATDAIAHIAESHRAGFPLAASDHPAEDHR